MLAAEESAPRDEGPAVAGAGDDAALRQRSDAATTADASASAAHDEQQQQQQQQHLDSKHPPAPTASDCEPPRESSALESRGESTAAPAPPSKEDGSSEANMAIGPAQDEIKPAAAAPGADPVCNLTLLLAAGGRHPYRLDAKYLARRNVAMPDLDRDGNPDPLSISIYTLKELILREWRADWEAKPASPSSIRLIYFGKLLDDKNQLKAYQFSSENPNVVHMSIRPQDLDDEEPKTGNKSLPTAQGTGQGARDGRCCVIL